MSNLSSHRPADYKLESFLPKNLGWEEEALFSTASKVRQYGETDWTDVPKIDYSSGGFTQLSIPEPAEVVDESDEGGEFVLDDLDSLRQMGQRKSGNKGEDKSKAPTNRNARALTLELVKTTYKVQDLSKSERLAREKLTNPQAHSNADQPFIPTYGESRRALLKKLGFSDDYELSLSGVDKNKVKAKENSDEDAEKSEHAGRESSENFTDPSKIESFDDEQDAFEGLEAKDKTDIEDDQEGDAKDLLGADSDEQFENIDSQQNTEEKGEPDDALEELDISASEAKLAREKAFEEGYQKALLEAKEKAAVQESLQAEIALKEEQKRAEAQAAKDKEALLQREKDRKEYENEIVNLKEKIKSFDESLLGELEKKKELLDNEMKPKVKVLTDLCDQLKELTEDSQSFFEPLKRLSVHIAEQLVLGELSASPKVIERLIQRCIEELDMRDTPVVKVELNPLDKALLESAAGANLQHLKVSAGQNMQVGSVRVSVNDTQIEDLIQNRLESIATRLLGQPQEWKDNSSLMNKQVEKSYFDDSKIDIESLGEVEKIIAKPDELARGLAEDDLVESALTEPSSSEDLESKDVADAMVREELATDEVAAKEVAAKEVAEKEVAASVVLPAGVDERQMDGSKNEKVSKDSLKDIESDSISNAAEFKENIDDIDVIDDREDREGKDA